MRNTVPNVVPASCCNAPWRLVAFPPSPNASFSASTPTIPNDTPFATSPVRASTEYQPVPRSAFVAARRRGSTVSMDIFVSLLPAPVTGETTADRPSRLRERVFRSRAALGRCEPAALRRDRSALHAVRGRDVHGHGSIPALGADFVHLRRAKVDPELRDLLRNAALDANVIRLVVAGLVPRREH